MTITEYERTKTFPYVRPIGEEINGYTIWASVGAYDRESKTVLVNRYIKYGTLPLASVSMDVDDFKNYYMQINPTKYGIKID